MASPLVQMCERCPNEVTSALPRDTPVNIKSDTSSPFTRYMTCGMVPSAYRHRRAPISWTPSALEEGGTWTWEEVVEHGLTLARALDGSADAAEVRVPGAVKRGRPRHEHLSPRELEVLRLIVAGRTNREIADELFVSPKTVMHHSSHIYRKLGVRGRVEAAAQAHRVGLFDSSGRD